MLTRSSDHRLNGWGTIVARYQQPECLRASFQILTTLLPLVGLFWLMYRSLSGSYLVTLGLAIPAGGLLVRTFIIMHDCGHGSFFKSRRANEIVGWVAGVLTMTPFAQWRKDHAIHHASSGDLDRRGHGDIKTATVREYAGYSAAERRQYRLRRSPLIMLGLGPIYLMLSQRRVIKDIGLNDIIAATDRGIVVKNRGSWSIDHQRYNFQFSGQVFYEVKGGKITGMLKDVAYQANTPVFWNSMDMIGGKSSYWLGGSFGDGKGEPGQSNSVSHGCPPARFKGVNIVSTGRGE